MKDPRNDHFHNTISAPNMIMEPQAPNTPYTRNLELMEEPPNLQLPISEIYEMFLQEANYLKKTNKIALSSSSRVNLWGQYRNSLNFSLNAITKNLSNALKNAYDKREVFRLKKSKTSIYSFIDRKDKAIKRWNRMDFVRCR